MELHLSDDTLTTKYIHDDQSETSIKMVQSCDNHIDNEGNIVATLSERNKYSVFLSSSTGCPLSCTFCHLTIKKQKYTKRSQLDLINNAKEAITAQYNANPDIANRYIKICWMGMGEAILSPVNTVTITIMLIDWALRNGYAKGVDGVDISTVLPTIHINWVEPFQRLNNELLKYNLNPASHIVVHGSDESTLKQYNNRSPLRIFYSLHTSDQAKRDILIPKTAPLDDAIDQLTTYSESNKYNVIFHLLFMEGINDSDQDMTELLEFIKTNNLTNYEFRVLRYNGVPGHDIQESHRFTPLVKQLTILPNLKAQISAGKEVLAACGQFYAGVK